MSDTSELKQGTDAWLESRMGKITASRVSDVMAKTKTGVSASRTNYMMQLLCERLTGKREDSYQNAAMQRGTELEPDARAVYEANAGEFVTETGMIEHETIKGFGASPDGLVGADGGLEIKCPNTATHIDFLRTGKPKGEYQWQMLAQMACGNLKWIDFVSYDDRLPPALQYHCIRFMRDDARIKEMEDEIISFLLELAKLEEEMKAKMAQ